VHLSFLVAFFDKKQLVHPGRLMADGLVEKSSAALGLCGAFHARLVMARKSVSAVGANRTFAVHLNALGARLSPCTPEKIEHRYLPFLDGEKNNLLARMLSW
jgi:hypothetical protein